VGNDARSGQAFGVLLRRYRSIAGLTQEELAERSGLSIRALSDMERGRTARPFLRSARLLADALELAEPARSELMAALQDSADGTGLPRQAAGSDGAYPRPEVPRQLPAPVPHFVGRAGELRALTRLLDRVDQERPGTVVISAIAGMAGVGKTALSVRWAHEVADRFPDGQLYANLRGYDPGQPMQPADVLAGFLRGLGVAGQDIPHETEERAAWYRSLLAGRRVLVLLDNASDAEQVRPLLPGSPPCMAVVTSRDALAGLVARDGAWRLDLDLLHPAEAAGLLRTLIGERAHANPEATAALAALCARLPLALRVAAELAVASPGVPLADVAAELADQQHRLDLLEAAGDPRTAIRAVFSWSVRHLDHDAARAFRFLGLHSGPDFDVHAVAALTGTGSEQARRLLDRLVRAYLIQPTGPGRYSMHDLLRAYAAAQAAEHDSEQDRRAALTRLFDHYLATAAAVADIFFPADPDRPQLPHVSSPGPLVTSLAEARAWLAAQRANLVAATEYAASHGWPEHAMGLAATVFRYPTTGHFADAAAVHSHACRAAAQTGDPGAEASALIMLGAALMAQGHLRQATSHLKQALRLYRKAGDRTGEARALAGLGVAGYCRGRYEQAISCDRQALALYREAGNRVGEARALSSLGTVHLRQGRYQQASGHFRRSLALYREGGIQGGEAHILGSLGELEMRQGRYPQAAGHLRRSLTLCRETGNWVYEARAQACLGLVMLRQRRYAQAIGHLRRALALHRETGNPSGQAEALNGLGEALLAVGHADYARARHADALALAIQAGDNYEQARAHNGLASACQATGDVEQANRHWQQALARYAHLHAPEAEQVRTVMTAAGRQPRA
jgi:tetratricopeptide (TPR) repeat protein/transcriptional regulator with XRE-family HTH domain